MINQATLPDSQVDLALLGRFEQGLNARWPEKSRIPARVLGYGEISTVLDIQSMPGGCLAYKRMPMFRTDTEAASYEALYREYVNVLQNRVGIQVVPGAMVRLQASKGKVVAYILQDKLPPESIGHHMLRHLSANDMRRLVQTALCGIKKVFDFNREHAHELQVGFDGQISNWAVLHFDAKAEKLPADLQLAYLDTSTPLLRKGGQEQLDPELFLRSAPSFLVWLLRLLYLEEVMTRYYDCRRVVLDLVANFNKEQRADLIPALIGDVNEYFAAAIQAGKFKPLGLQEVRAYYKQDAQIWSAYLTARKVDRFLHRLIGKEYPYILPEKIRR